MNMTIDPKLNHRISLLVNSLGLSCLGGAIFLQILVFSTILTQGYFRAVENSPSILSLEIGLTAFSAVYFLYLYQKVIRTTMGGKA
jgi:hypothetical protein